MPVGDRATDDSMNDRFYERQVEVPAFLGNHFPEVEHAPLQGIRLGRQLAENLGHLQEAAVDDVGDFDEAVHESSLRSPPSVAAIGRGDRQRAKRCRRTRSAGRRSPGAAMGAPLGPRRCSRFQRRTDVELIDGPLAVPALHSTHRDRPVRLAATSAFAPGQKGAAGAGDLVLLILCGRHRCREGFLDPSVAKQGARIRPRRTPQRRNRLSMRAAPRSERTDSHRTHLSTSLR